MSNKLGNRLWATFASSKSHLGLYIAHVYTDVCALYLCVCMHLCMHLCMNVCIRVCMYVHMHWSAFMYVCMYNI